MKQEKERVFLGKYEGEELYFNLKDRKLAGWSLMGLRPKTEKELRERMRDSDPQDYGMEIPDQMIPYFDFNRWYDDIEEDWFEHHDSQGEYVKDGETYYLGFGMGTDIFNFLLEHKIRSFKKWESVVEDSNINKVQFEELLSILKEYDITDYDMVSEKNKKAYCKFMVWQVGVSQFPEGCKEVDIQ